LSPLLCEIDLALLRPPTERFETNAMPAKPVEDRKTLDFPPSTVNAPSAEKLQRCPYKSAVKICPLGTLRLPCTRH